MAPTSSPQNTSSSSTSFVEFAPSTEEEERGHWYYLVADSAGIRPRADPSYSKETKQGSQPRIKEGTVVEVGVRRRATWMRWLYLNSGAGWVHDVSPKDYKIRMVEVEVVQGDWEYQVGLDKVPILWELSLALAENPPKGGMFSAALEPGQVFNVCQRVRPIGGQGMFLKLTSAGGGRGYVYDVYRGQQVVHELQKSGVDSLGGHSPLFAKAGTEPQLSSINLKRGNSLNLTESELGEWDYIVLDPNGVSLRYAPTFEASGKNNARLLQGEIVKVVERKRCDATTFVRLDTPWGWAFDVHGDRLTKQYTRIAPVSVEQGLWFYRVATAKGVALRSRCSLDDSAKMGKGPMEGAFVTIVTRAQVGEVQFLRSRELEAWIPDRKDGRLLLDGPIAVTAHDCQASVRPEVGVSLLAAPTRHRWAQTKKTLLRGARVHVLHSVGLEGEVWAQVSQPGGMEGWTFLFNVALEEPPPKTPTRCDRELIQKAYFAPNPVSLVSS